jgi:hypothetical protein
VPRPPSPPDTRTSEEMAREEIGWYVVSLESRALESWVCPLNSPRVLNEGSYKLHQNELRRPVRLKEFAELNVIGPSSCLPIRFMPNEHVIRRRVANEEPTGPVHIPVKFDGFEGHGLACTVRVARALVRQFRWLAAADDRLSAFNGGRGHRVC